MITLLFSTITGSSINSSFGTTFSIINVSVILVAVLPTRSSNSWRLIGSLPSSKYSCSSFFSYISLPFLTNSSKLIIAFSSCSTS